MQEGVGILDARGKALAVSKTVEALAVGGRRGGKIVETEIGARIPGAAFHALSDASSVFAERRAIDARGRPPQRLALKSARGCRERIPIVRLVARGDGTHSLVEQRDLRLEGIAEEARYAQRDIDARMIELGDGQDLDAAHARRALIPHGARAHEEKRERKVLAAGAHGGAAPHIHHQRARPVAVILEVAAEQFLRSLLGEHERRAGRHRARIDGIEIAPGGQHVGAAARRRARRTWSHEFAVESGEQCFALT